MGEKKHNIVLNVQVRALGVRGLREGRIISWHHVAWATNFFTLEPNVFKIVVVVIPYKKYVPIDNALNRKH